MSGFPLPARRDHRHPRRRPAGPHAGAGGGAAGLRHPDPGSGAGLLRRAGFPPAPSWARYDDPDALEAFSHVASVATFEFENVPAVVIERLQALGVPVAPGPRALAVAQDRVDEKTFLNACGAPTVGFVAVDSEADIRTGLDQLGAPALLKTRREGYDGKGQTWVESHADAASAFARIGGAAAILEARPTSPASSRSSPHAAATGRCQPTRWARTTTRTASCAARSRPPW